MTSEPAVGPRERYRNQVRAEVLELGWAQVAEAGASALSLKAIAKQMGISAPALYRYFGSRDELLTELIVSAYRDLAELVETATAAADPGRARVAAAAAALRDWALGNPHRYLLLYGTPVPGYAAPAEATDLAVRIFTPLVAAFSTLDPDETLATRRSLGFWTRAHGVLSLEAAGHFAGMGFDPAQLYAEELDSVLAPFDA